ncbi:hypothetical protein BHM03_00034716 [Ensete ventricosum]|nr:hypothetical protein BHM03_00034716 [Ensete ventricosum]
MEGYIYASDCKDGCKLRVFEGATDSWTANIILEILRSFEAASFVSLDGKLGIIRNNMSIISLVDVTNPGNGIETNSARSWETLSIQVLAAIPGLHWIEIRSTVGCAAMASTGYEVARRLEGGQLKGGGMNKEAQHGHGHTHGRTAHNMSSSSLRKKSDLALVSKVRCRFLRALLANLQEIFLGTKLFVLFPAVPLAVAASYFNFGRQILAVAAVGGLLNATCGNATELIIALFALREGKIEVVKCSLVGSVLSNLLLVLGTSLFFGGLANLHKEQFYDRVSTHPLRREHRSAPAGRAVPHPSANVRVRHELRRAPGGGRCSKIGIVESVQRRDAPRLRCLPLLPAEDPPPTVRIEGDEDNDGGVSEDEPVIGFPSAVAWLAGMTAVIAALSEYVVGTIEVLFDPIRCYVLSNIHLQHSHFQHCYVLSSASFLQAASDSWGISVSFISIILLPILTCINNVEMSQDITLGVSLGSATQISMFVVRS